MTQPPPISRVKLLLTHNSILPMIAAFLAGLVILILTAPAWVWALILLGIPTQMLNEYNLHRNVFHITPPRKQWAFNLLYRVHYGHHDFPTNTHLFFVPIWVSIPLLCVNFFGLWAILALLGLANALPISAAITLVGGVGTFLAYEWFHMTAHLSVRKTAIERHVTTLHNQHHFRDFSKWFHVSPGGEIIDKAMGTAIDRDALKSQQRIEFIRTLGMRPDDPRLIKARAHFASRLNLTDADLSQAARA